MPATLLRAGDGLALDLDGVGVRYLIRGEQTGGRFSLVEHPIAPRTLGAAMHVHQHEDEYSFVTAGRVGVQIGDEVLEVGRGELVLKPRGVPHAFWNAHDEPASLLELISPAGFEQFFTDLAGLMGAEGGPDEAAVAHLLARFGLNMDFASGADLARRHGLRNEF
jgi:mannose-6-phosphate isomerase-like protein (cupin superfamily)